jgi:NAD+ synthase (glutamine-hydrolysing)
VVLQRGRILGAVPKSYLPNYREFYEKRQFAPAAQAVSTSVRIAGQDVPFGSELLFAARNLEGFVLHVEICEDLWVPLPPSTLAALAGATLIANLSASDITVGKADYRRLICAAQSAKCVAGYLYSAAGPGESTTDLAWDGQALVYENGERLAESQRFPLEGGLITADIDLDHLRQERTRLTSFGDCVQIHALGYAISGAWSSISSGPKDGCRSSGASSVSRTCRPIPRAATSAVPRSMTSRSRD